METSNDHISQMRLYNQANQRLYINASERARFLKSANQLSPAKRAFCLTLLFTGCRISEALELAASSIQPDERIITFRTLKRRRENVYREVPVPAHLIETLQAALSLDSVSATAHLWGDGPAHLNRVTAYRWIKEAMTRANISGAHACPKGLRHGYGIHAVRSGVQLNMLQKWMGHAAMTTTAIYANACGAEELEIADRMWEG